MGALRGTVEIPLGCRPCPPHPYPPAASFPLVMKISKAANTLIYSLPAGLVA